MNSCRRCGQEMVPSRENLESGMCGNCFTLRKEGVVAGIKSAHESIDVILAAYKSVAPNEQRDMVLLRIVQLFLEQSKRIEKLEKR